MSDDGNIYIADLAERLNRAEHTIRQWIRRGDFPQELKPQAEGGRAKLFWVQSQMAGLERYARERDAARGSFGRS